MPLITYDGANGSASATSATDLVEREMSGFNSMVIQVTDAGTSCTITYETSNDRNTWVQCAGITVTATGLDPPVTQTQTTGMWSFPRTGRYFRARVSSYTSDTVTIYWVQSQQPVFIAT